MSWTVALPEWSKSARLAYTGVTVKCAGACEARDSGRPSE